MIANPTVPQLLQNLKAELADKIAPALTDPTHVVAVQMMTALLDSLSVRVENEIEWMIEEITSVQKAAENFVVGRPDATVVAEALADLKQHSSSSLKLSDVRAQYDRAGAVLSAFGDAAYGSRDAAGINAVEKLVQQRLDTEMAVVGSFVAVGRE